MQLDEKWAIHHNWGLHRSSLTRDRARKLPVLGRRSSKARLRDGTLIEVPEDGPLPELDLKPALESNRKVTIYLGVPVAQVEPSQHCRGGAVGERTAIT